MTKRALLLVMILPLFLMQFSNTAFRHWHVSPDGQVFEHAHPFRSGSEKSGPGHQHTDRELLLFTVISDSPLILLFLAMILVVYRTRENDIEALPSISGFSGRTVTFQFLRAPPAVI
jgi:hypothetical protein